MSPHSDNLLVDLAFGALLVGAAAVGAVRWLEHYVPFRVAVALVAVAGVGLGVLTVYLLARHNKGSAKRMKGRSTSWATQRDLRKAGLLVDSPQPGRLTVGKTGSRQLAVKREHSLLVIGPVGSMKTTGLVVPNVLEWDGPLVVCSSKTDVFHATRGARSRMGEVLNFDPSGATGVPSDGWSPLRKAQTWGGALRTAKSMVSGTAVSGMRDKDFWESSSRQALAPLLLAAAVDGQDMGAVAGWVSEEDVDEAGAILDRYAETNPECRPGIQNLASLKRKDPKLRGSVFQTVGVALDAYHDPDVLNTSSAWNINPGAFFADGKQSNTLYISGSQQEQERLAPLFLALIQEFIDFAYAMASANRAACGQTVPPGHKPLLLMFDEAANIAPLRSLPNLASTGRSEGIYVCSVYQDVSQIKSAFGDDLARSVFSNHVAKVILPGSTDKETLATFQQVIGQEDVVETSTSRSAGGTSTSEQVRQRDVIGSRELRELRTGDGVWLYLNHPPVRFSLRPFFRDRNMQALVDTAPLVPADQVDHKVLTGEGFRLLPDEPSPVAVRRDDGKWDYYLPQGYGYALATSPTQIAALDRARESHNRMAERSQP